MDYDVVKQSIQNKLKTQIGKMRLNSWHDQGHVILKPIMLIV